MAKFRFDAISAASAKRPVEVKAEGRPSEYFGCKVFSRHNMFRYLPEKVYRHVTEMLETGSPLDEADVHAMADGMKRWAMDNGATHYTHWFSPLTGNTAEKHDAFIEPDGKGGVIEDFPASLLVQQEPDASSFPSGGMRSTFEARGYSAWDPTSPAFIIGDTLCIPTIFISYTGEALDYKAPLLKALRAVGKAATDVCHYFDRSTTRVLTYLGWEQEFFLVDEDLYLARPDLVLTGRTLMGHDSAKNQQLDDHYFGAIPARVAAFMRELEIEAMKLGIPTKTCHNEAAPNQFEIAPVYEECNLAIDHNMVLMSLMKEVARRHGFRVLLHEKPFKGINGSGKHCNWSLGTSSGASLLAPGKTDKENLRFITFVVNTLAAIYRAVYFNEPMYERMVTVSGDAIANPGNYLVKVGTPVSQVIEAAGGFANDERMQEAASLSKTKRHQNIVRVRNEIRDLGNVNVGAIEEYKALSERLTFLTTQHDDIVKSADDLREIIQRMTERMEKQFSEGFAKVAQAFNVVFTQMFGGGQGVLKLTEGENELEAGIEINVQPPGKKRQLLSLFSGGERALTAIAILFAMLKLKPTPFCILDEIEAALDDANIGYYADYLREYSQGTQFIVVTHRKGTMERCNALYGVAMEVQGVSKMVSVSLQDYEA